MPTDPAQAISEEKLQTYGALLYELRHCHVYIQVLFASRELNTAYCTDQNIT